MAAAASPTSPKSPTHFQAGNGVKNSSIKRIMSEWQVMQQDKGKYGYDAHPDEDDIFEWHFTFHGAEGDFAGGVYHGRINLPPEYPFKPPAIMLLKSGRFEVNKKICLSISNYHPEHWQPSWDIRTIITALIAFMPSDGQGAIGALDFPPEERRKLATKSRTFKCAKCGDCAADFINTVPLPSAPVVCKDGAVTAGKVKTPGSPQSQPPTPTSTPASPPAPATPAPASAAAAAESSGAASPQAAAAPSPQSSEQASAQSPPTQQDSLAEPRAGTETALAASTSSQAWGGLEWLAVALVVLLLAVVARKYSH